MSNTKLRIISAIVMVIIVAIAAVIGKLGILGLIFIAGIVPWCLGMFTFYHLLRPQNPPADTSNRINAIRLWWFSLTREELFIELFPWLKNDEKENINGN